MYVTWGLIIELLLIEVDHYYSPEKIPEDMNFPLSLIL